MEATERKAREEREASERRAAQAAKEQADAAAKAQAEATAAEREAEASRNRPPQLVIPLRSVASNAPVPPSKGADRGQEAAERREDDVVVLEEGPRSTPTGTGPGGQPAAAPVQLAGSEPAARAGLEVQPAPRRRAEGAIPA